MNGLRLEYLLGRCVCGRLGLEYCSSFRRGSLDAQAPRSADDPPKRTPTFVCEVPLRVSRAQERTLLARLEAARQVRVTCLGQARQRVRLVRESKAYRHARTLPRDDPARKERFREARAQHGFSEYALHDYAQQFGHSWLGEHLDSLTIQTLASRAYRAANRLLVGKARRVRFKGRHQLDTVEGKTNTSGPRWRGTRVEWKGLELQARLDPHDQVQAHRLACPVKYVRLVRRKLGERNRFYAQWCARDAVAEAAAPAGQRDRGAGPGALRDRGGLRAGRAAPGVLPRGGSRRPSAAPAGSAARPAAAGQQPGQLRRAGPGQAGQTALEGVQAPRQVQARRREVYRKLAATRKRSHGQLAHRVLGMGSAFHLEQLSYRAWQKTYGKSVQRCAPGMFVERLSRLAAVLAGRSS